MINLSQYRIVDLSRELIPGERKIDGTYLHGEPHNGRPIELEEFIAFEARMHFLHGQTHTGTHVEAPYKYDTGGTDIGAMPLDHYIGEAVVCRFEDKAAGQPITEHDFQAAGVRRNDIVLARGSRETANDRPYFTTGAVDWLIETGIKLLGCEYLRMGPPDVPYGPGYSDERLLSAGIPLLDGPFDLARLRAPRVFVIALPLRVRRMTASWTRAIALEPVDA
jgi:arylformamidase